MYRTPGFRIDVFKRGLQVALFFVNECLAIGDEEAHVAHLALSTVGW